MSVPAARFFADMTFIPLSSYNFPALLLAFSSQSSFLPTLLVLAAYSRPTATTLSVAWLLLVRFISLPPISALHRSRSLILAPLLLSLG